MAKWLHKIQHSRTVAANRSSGSSLRGTTGPYFIEIGYSSLGRELTSSICPFS